MSLSEVNFHPQGAALRDQTGEIQTEQDQDYIRTFHSILYKPFTLKLIVMNLCIVASNDST